MSDATSEDQAPSAAEDGELSPSSASPSAKAPDRLPPIEATPVEEAVAVLAEVLPAGDRERTRQIIKTLMGWSGPLPPPDELQEYGQAAPGAAELILADFEQRSELEIEATRHQMRTVDRELAILEREQTLRFDESKADIATRVWVQRAGSAFTPLMLVGAFATVMFAPVQSDWARFALASLWFLPLLVFGAAVLLRGRYSDNERDVMWRTLPRIAGTPGRKRKNPRATDSATRKEIAVTASEDSQADEGERQSDIGGNRGPMTDSRVYEDDRA